jgi:hypothetical protein
MNDRPTATELIAAVRHYLETELLPALTDQRQRFQTLISAHVLGVASRELRGEEQHLAEEHAWLARLLGWREAAPARLSELRQAVARGNSELCSRIRAGAYDEPAAFRTLAGELRVQVIRKLEVTNPRYLGRSGS